MFNTKTPSHSNQQNQQQDASFPVMPVADICDCLAALNVPVMQEDLQRPSALAAQHIYAGLVSELMGIPLDMLEGPKQSLMGMLEYKDMYAEALQFTMFFKHVKNLAETCGCRNFSMADLTKPDAARLRHNLSGIINFAKFRDERSVYQQQLQDQTRQQVEKADRMRKMLEKTEGAIEDITIRSAADAPKLEEAKARNDELRKQLLELRESQVGLSREVEEAKKERTFYNEQATSKVNELNQINLQISSARSRLVQSPERIKKHINEMAHNVTQDKGTLAQYQRKARELGTRVDIINTLETDMRGLIDLSKGIDNQRTKVEEARRSMHALRARLEGKNIDSQGLMTKLQQLERQVQNAGDRQKRSEDMARDVRERTETRMTALKEDYLVKKVERAQWEKIREELQTELERLKGEEQAWISKNEKEMNDMLAEYWTMRKQAEDYMNTMTVKLGLKLRTS